jgi:hypothetical protein
MLSQRPANAARAGQASAESLPFADDSVDAVPAALRVCDEQQQSERSALVAGRQRRTPDATPAAMLVERDGSVIVVSYVQDETRPESRRMGFRACHESRADTALAAARGDEEPRNNNKTFGRYPQRLAPLRPRLGRLGQVEGEVTDESLSLRPNPGGNPAMPRQPPRWMPWPVRWIAVGKMHFAQERDTTLEVFGATRPDHH